MLDTFTPDNIWFTADHHFFHAGILHPDHGSSRADRWSTSADMTRALLEQWRDTVGPRDIVHVLGDLTFRVGVTKTLELYKQLTGFQINVMTGNHDDAMLRKLSKRGELPRNMKLVGASIEEYVGLDYRIGGQQVFMRHYPEAAGESWPGQAEGTLLLHGHSHGNKPKHPARLDVGWDVHSRLLSLADVRAHFEERELDGQKTDVEGARPAP